MPAITAFRVKTGKSTPGGGDTFRAKRNDLNNPQRSCGTFDRFHHKHLLSGDRSPDALGAAVVRLFPAPPTLTTFALELLGIRREEQVAASDGLMPFQDPAFTG